MARPGKPLQLSDEQLLALTKLFQGGKAQAQTQTRARILDLLHRHKHPKDIAALLRVSTTTVFNVKSRFLEGGLKRALHDLPRSGKPARITAREKAAITALACTDAPEGRARWTLRLLADACVRLEIIGAVSHNEVGRILKKTSCARTAKSSGASAG